MATRRIVNTDKDILDKGGINASSPPAKLLTPAVIPKYCTSFPAEREKKKLDIAELTYARSVVAKLLLFTLAMVVAPLGSYYITLNTIFKGAVKNLTPPPIFFSFFLKLTWELENKNR